MICLTRASRSARKGGFCGAGGASPAARRWRSSRSRTEGGRRRKTLQTWHCLLWLVETKNPPTHPSIHPSVQSVITIPHPCDQQNYIISVMCGTIHLLWLALSFYRVLLHRCGWGLEELQRFLVSYGFILHLVQ